LGEQKKYIYINLAKKLINFQNVKTLLDVKYHDNMSSGHGLKIGSR